MSGLIEARKGTTSAGKTLALNPALIGHAAQVGRSLVLEHGHDPCTRKQAAFHEAGHAVVLAAFGARIKSCEIRKRRAPHSDTQLWLGLTYCDDNSWHQGRPNQDGNYLSTDQSIEYLVRTGMDTLAGIAGEIVTNTWHPSSSIDENVTGLSIASALDSRYGLAHSTAGVVLMALNTNLLDQHRVIFLELGHLLAKHKKLSGGVVAHLLRGVEPCPSAKARFIQALMQFQAQGGAA